MMLPVALNLEGRAVLIVGGGAVAARKAASFVECGARVTVISPELNAAFLTVQHEARRYAPGDCAGFSLVCACTNSREVNALVGQEARASGIWCNLADDPQKSDFHTAAVVRREAITVGITTDGASPVLARHVKGKIEDAVGQEYAQLLEIAGSYRIEAKKRGDVWRRLLESEILPLLKIGNRDEAVALFESLLL